MKKEEKLYLIASNLIMALMTIPLETTTIHSDFLKNVFIVFKIYLFVVVPVILWKCAK